MDHRSTHHLHRPDLEQAFVSRSIDELRYHAARSDRMQALLIAEALMSAFDGLTHVARTVTGAVAGWRRQAATRHALEACSDRTLADIGIAREDIPAVASASSNRRELAKRLQTARQQRRIDRELRTYSDRELDELGIRRRDIPEIARAA